MATNVPFPTFGPNGFTSPTQAAILAGILADFNAAFGASLNPGLSTPQGQLASSLAAILGNAYDTFVNITNQVDPAFATGKMQDAIGRIYYLSRNPAQSTVLQVACVGAPGVVIPVGATLQDGSKNVYVCTAAGTIPSNGTITLPFANIIPGALAVPVAGPILIYRAIPGWDTATIVSGVLGNAVESATAFEARRSASVAANSMGSLSAVQAAVLKVPNVLDVYVSENTTNAPQVIGGVTLAPNSLYVAVVGGDAQAVAQAIWSRKAPGCAYNGNTTVTVLDTSPGYTAPFPAYAVTFQIPASLPILFAVNIVNSPAVPADAVTQIQNALLNAFAGGDGGPRAKIGTTLFASRFYDAVDTLGPWAQVIFVEIGSANSPAATFTGSISGTTLTVTSVASGAIAIGQTISNPSGNILPSTKITAGAGLSWTVNQAQTVASETIKSAVANLFSTGVNINQVPTLAAADITVTLT